MKKFILSLVLIASCAYFLNAQIVSPSFGKGVFNIISADSTFTMKFGMRFQNLVTSTWTQDENNTFADPQTNFLIRRARFKFDGYAFSPKLEYKFEVGLSNRDQSGGGTSDYSNAPRYILDAIVTYKFDKNWSIKFGQGKLPGNRERVISSGNLQFVDRSRLNSRFNIDRDFGLHVIHSGKIGPSFILKKIATITQGEGRNITSGNKGGLDYTFRLEALPMGSFASKGDYIGSSIKRESTPKLSIGATYDININAGKSRGQNGSLIPFEDGFEGRTLYTFFADMMFKYEGLSVMAEYADKKAADDEPVVIVDGRELGTYYTGSGLSIQAGYMFPSNYEVALRYTEINPDEGVDQGDTRYTFGLSKFIVDHKLKIQTDITLRNREVSGNQLIYRAQMDLHF